MSLARSVERCGLDIVHCGVCGVVCVVCVACVVCVVCVWCVSLGVWCAVHVQCAWRVWWWWFVCVCLCVCVVLCVWCAGLLLALLLKRVGVVVVVVGVVGVHAMCVGVVHNVQRACGPCVVVVVGGVCA